MTETQASGPAPRIASSVIIAVFLALALSFVALIYALSILDQDYETASIFLIMGFLGVALSTYVLFQTRRRLSKLKIVVPPVTTTIECKKCGFKNVREFQRGDYIFKEGEPCQKCSDKMLITAIYREVKQKEKEKVPF
jgi:cation transport ATPase